MEFDILGYLSRYLMALVDIVNEMSLYLVFGFLLAGVLHVLLPERFARKHLGGSSLFSSIKASIIGVPLPLCSCGVIPTALGFYKSGASKSSTLSFLISTPQTGVDSIMITGAMIGWPFAIFRAIIAFVTGVFGGLFSGLIDKDQESVAPQVKMNGDIKRGFWGSIREMVSFPFGEFLSGMAHYLLIGTLIAALISTIIPDNYFETLQGNSFLIYLLVLIASVPLYICATSSVPIAAVLLLKGLSPGAALIFLMAGPATNAATITVLYKTLGRKSLIVYLLTIIGSSFLFGWLFDLLIPVGWLISPLGELHKHTHSLLPDWVFVGASILLSSITLFYVAKRIYLNYKPKPIFMETDKIKTSVFYVEGMSCVNCKAKIEKNLSEMPGVTMVSADTRTRKVSIQSEYSDNEIVEKLNEIGYSSVKE